ncbi:cytochrome P450 [Fulvivirga ulvae]|uniref:cytochrome P450 n=1 Tax=Fulvivirga ulvae TaxID=2904245 RepID=UPI00210287F9|nr:cytochrome P450 [Fulvivirga ulvae]
MYHLTEETLRHRPSFQMTIRLAKEDAELNGQVISKGQVVLAMIGSANREESKFCNADVFDIHRHPNPHLALGQGIHFCLRAPLVHLEAKNALAALLKRYSTIEYQEPFTLYPSENSAVYGLRSLPLRVSK